LDSAGASRQHYDWARLQQGLAAMIGRDDGQAREAFQAVEKQA
jgi:hypothetical protein